MVKISDLFEVKRGVSHSESEYPAGDVPFVSSTGRRNGVASYVTPFPDDKVFEGGLVTVSCFGHAFYQPASFLPKANGGSAVAVLVPRTAKGVSWMLAFCAAFNQAHEWRFGFGRMASGQNRLDDLELDESLIERIAAQVKVDAPKPVALDADVLHRVVAKLQEMFGDSPTVGDVFELKQGKATTVADLSESGAIPVVSATEKEVNAVAGYVDAGDGELMPAGSLSVAKNGKPGVTRLQPQPWGATTDVACLWPRTVFSAGELLALAALIERQCWRFGYGRKASDGRLAELRLLDGLPGTQPTWQVP